MKTAKWEAQEDGLDRSPVVQCLILCLGCGDFSLQAAIAGGGHAPQLLAAQVARCCRSLGVCGLDGACSSAQQV
jgi:hypothetical protein